LNYAGDRYLTPTHEFGHALGLWHQNNNSNAIMSYSKERSIRALDYERVINAYGVSK
jgi:predicted Zn-dependent protease